MIYTRTRWKVQGLGCPLAVMKMIIEVFNEDRMAHPHRADVFVVPRLMTRHWRKQLGKDADIATGDHFWENPSTNH